MAAKKDFLAKAKATVKTVSVPLPTMKMNVTARALSVAEIDEITGQCLLPGKTLKDHGGEAIDSQKQILCIVAASVFDDDGERLIPAGREAELRDLPQAVYGPLQTAALKVNGMLEDAVKNS